MKTFTIIFTPILAFVVFFGVAVGLGYTLGNLKDKTACQQYTEQTGKQTKFHWSWVSSCYVKTDKGWFRLDQVRNY